MRFQVEQNGTPVDGTYRLEIYDSAGDVRVFTHLKPEVMDSLVFDYPRPITQVFPDSERTKTWE